MVSQIFKNIIPKEELFKLLDNICYKTNKYYLFNNNSFNKGLFTEQIQNFFEFCKPYYSISKRKKYIERELNYNSFITILRQICKSNNITYTSNINYDKSNYYITYYIYYYQM
jgi:hypothetical protein